MTSLCDEIERLGDFVQTGIVAESDAAHRLVQFSEGRVTLVGARDLLRDPHSARQRYAAGVVAASARLTRISRRHRIWSRVRGLISG